MLDGTGQAGVQITDEMTRAATAALLAECGDSLDDLADEPDFIARRVLEAALGAERS